MTVQKNENAGRHRLSKSRLYWIALGVGIVGLLLLAGSIPAPDGWLTLTNWPPVIAPAGATLAIGALASSVALYAAVSWEDQRAAAELDEERRRAKDRAFETWKVRAGYYDAIAVSVVKQFVGISNIETMAQDRARAVVWGSPQVVEALERWDVVNEAVRTGQIESLREEGKNDDTEKSLLWDAMLALVQRMRGEIPDEEGRSLSDRQILRAVFSDYRALDDAGEVNATSV